MTEAENTTTTETTTDTTDTDSSNLSEDHEEKMVNLDTLHEQVDDCLVSSPINININNAKELKLPTLIWNNYEKMPKKVKLTNSGQTLILSAKWPSVRPYLSGGPLKGSYVFSQAHFHWGKDALEGSEHTFDGGRQPLEMHAIHYNKEYLCQEDALLVKNGVIVLVYLFNIKSKHSSAMHRIVSAFHAIKFANTSVALEPFVITTLLYPFVNDYYVYGGMVHTKDTTPCLMWIITRELTNISVEQLRLFRFLLDTHMRPIRKSFREVNSNDCKKFFFINPETKFTNSTLSTVPMRLLTPEDKICDTCSQRYSEAEHEKSDQAGDFCYKI